MATTQFEATDARAAFPCFDEPKFKSQFIVTLVHEKGYSALSNMPVEKVITRDDGFMESHFKESVKMSTYLLAFIVCDFAYKETHSKAGKKVGVIEPIKCLHFSVVLCLLLLTVSAFTNPHIVYSLWGSLDGGPVSEKGTKSEGSYKTGRTY